MVIVFYPLHDGLFQFLRFGFLIYRLVCLLDFALYLPKILLPIFQCHQNVNYLVLNGPLSFLVYCYYHHYPFLVYDSGWDITLLSSIFRVNILENFYYFIGVNMIKRKKVIVFDLFLNLKDTRMSFTLVLRTGAIIGSSNIDASFKKF